MFGLLYLTDVRGRLHGIVSSALHGSCMGGCIGTVSAIITAVGVIIAGGFAYFKFIKGRTFRPRCSIDIDPQLMEIGESRALQVSVTVRNEGLVALLFPSDIPQSLFVGQADSAIWKQACERRRRVAWERSRIPKGR